MWPVPSLKIDDDLGRTLLFGRAPRRIISLVPSDTYSVIALGAGDRLVGRTSYCEHGDGVAIVGGTKDVDPEKVLALEPDLVIANQEENSRKPLEALAGKVPVLVSLPRTVEQGVAHLARLARILEVGGELVRRAYALAPAAPQHATCFVPIWMDPLMTINGDTFGSDVLARAGLGNAFGDRLRLYPLAADLGKGEAIEATGRDVRYPRITLGELTARGASPANAVRTAAEPVRRASPANAGRAAAPEAVRRASPANAGRAAAPEAVRRTIDAIVLPDEPHAFSVEDEAVLHAALPHARVVRTSGKDLFWYGAWTVDALPRVRELAATIGAGEAS